MGTAPESRAPGDSVDACAGSGPAFSLCSSDPCEADEGRAHSSAKRSMSSDASVWPSSESIMRMRSLT